MDNNQLFILFMFILAGFFLSRTLKRKKEAATHLAEGQAFLEKNAQEEGVETTASGLQYQVLEAGQGDVKPTATDKVTVHYHGTLLNGDVFDSSVDRGQPITFGVKQVIRGWQEGLQLMVIGQKVRFFIPAPLAYGNRGIGKIPAGSLLIFDVELLEIQSSRS